MGTMLEEIKAPIDNMVQGLAFWIAYKGEISTIDLTEADIVSEAAHILSTRFSNYYIKREVEYSLLDTSLPKQYADLGIYSREDKGCKCVIEFKLGDNTNGGYKRDIQKISDIKKARPDIDCLVVIAYRTSCTAKVPKELVTNQGRAKRGTIIYSKVSVKVRRVCNAMRSIAANKMKKVVCLEIL